MPKKHGHSPTPWRLARRVLPWAGEGYVEDIIFDARNCPVANFHPTGKGSYADLDAALIVKAVNEYVERHPVPGATAKGPIL